MAIIQEDLTYKVIKESNGRNFFYCLGVECNGLRRSKCRAFNKHREQVHGWEPITLHVGAPRGHNYKLRSASRMERERKRKNYDVEYRFRKNRKAMETAAIRREVQSEGVKGADELSEDAVARIKRIVAQYDAQPSEKKSALRNIVRKKVIKDKDWEALRKIFNESPLRYLDSSSDSPLDDYMYVEETVSGNNISGGQSFRYDLNQTPDISEDVDKTPIDLNVAFDFSQSPEDNIMSVEETLSRNVCNSSLFAEDNIVSVEETPARNIVYVGDPSSSNMNECIEQGEGISQTLDVGEDVDVIQCSSHSFSRPIFDRSLGSVPLGPTIFDMTPDSVPLGSAIFDRTPAAVPLGSPIFDRTPAAVPLGSPIFDRTPNSVCLGPPMSKNVQKTPKENVQNVLNEEGDRVGEDNTVVNHGKVQNANTQRRGHKRTFLTPSKTKDKNSKYHHPSFYSQSIANTKRPRACTMKRDR